MNQRAADRETERGRERYKERKQGEGKEGEQEKEEVKSHGAKHIHRCHSDVSSSCVCFGVCEHKKRREGREENKSWELESSPGFISPSFFYLHHPRHEGGCQLAWQNKRKGCFECCLSFDKEQGRGRGVQHTAGTKTGFLE